MSSGNKKVLSTLRQNNGAANLLGAAVTWLQLSHSRNSHAVNYVDIQLLTDLYGVCICSSLTLHYLLHVQSKVAGQVSLYTSLTVAFCSGGSDRAKLLVQF